MVTENSITNFCNPTKEASKKLRFSRLLKKVKGDLYVTRAPLKREELIYCAKHLIARKYKRGEILRSTDKVKDFFITELANYDKEVFAVLFLDAANRILGYQLLSIGSLTYANIYVRDLLKAVLAKSATAVIIAHNHLSTNIQPSRADIGITLKISVLLQEIEATLLDHIIIGGGKAFSFIEHGLMITSQPAMNSISRVKTMKQSTQLPASNLTENNNKETDVYNQIASIIREARSRIRSVIDTTMVQAYWYIGKYIVDEEQKGSSRSSYGEELLQKLSDKLTKEFGIGFGVDTLDNARKFYLVYKVEISDALRRKSQSPQFKTNLSWTHYRSLMRITDTKVRNFYEVEASENNWSSRELQRQIGSLLFERLAKSKNKKEVMKLARKGQILMKPEDAIKEPVVLEFLDIPESHKLVESKLEQALITNMQKFLLELGRGFAFVARQKRLTLDGDNFYCDLVFYNVVLKCYFILDVKCHPVSHSDLGQMLLYVNYFDQEVIAEGDNPTVGLVLCTKSNKKMTQYTLGDKAKQVFVSKYQFHLPTEKELEEELKREEQELKHKLEYEER